MRTVTDDDHAPAELARGAAGSPAASGPARGAPVGGSSRRSPAAALAGAPGVALLGALAVLGVLVGAALLGGAADPPGIGDPGPVTRWGLLVARTAYDLASIGTLGVLLLVVVLLPRAGDGFGSDASRIVPRVTWWAAAWAATAVATLLLTLSSVAGRPVRDVLAPDVLALALELESTRALLSAAWLATLVAIGARVTRSPATGLLLVVTAAGAMVLPLLTGHAGHGEVPALTATSLAVHVVAASTWVGGLAAVVLHLRRSGLALAVVLPRFSRVALVCFVLVGLSGAVTGWASLNGPADLWSSSYGTLLLGKVAALAVLGAIGHGHRRRTVAAVVARRPRAFLRLAAAELVLMGCAAALAVALSHTAPPVEPHTAPVVPAAVQDADA